MHVILCTSVCGLVCVALFVCMFPCLCVISMCMSLFGSVLVVVSLCMCGCLHTWVFCGHGSFYETVFKKHSFLFFIFNSYLGHVSKASAVFLLIVFISR